jgi:hypothetical protein
MLIRPKNWANKHATRKLDLLPGGMLTLSPGQRKHVLCNTHTFSTSPIFWRESYPRAVGWPHPTAISLIMLMRRVRRIAQGRASSMAPSYLIGRGDLAPTNVAVTINCDTQNGRTRRSAPTIFYSVIPAIPPHVIPAKGLVEKVLVFIWWI